MRYSPLRTTPAKRLDGRPTRRDVLRTLCAAPAAAAVVVAPVAAEAPAARPQTFRIGYQIYSFGRYFPANWWAGVEAVSAIGYRGVEGESTIAELYEGRENEFGDRMARQKVQLAALYSTSDLERPHEQYENLRKNMQAAAFAKRFGCRTIVVGGTEARHGRAPALYAAWAREANALGQRTLESYGVRIGVHPHLGSLISSRDEIARVMDATDPRYVGLAPDTGHLAGAGCDPVEVFRTYASRIVHGHLKDYAAPAGQPPGTRGAFVALGRGSVDFRALAAILNEHGFDGWMDVELDSSRTQTPAEVARDARDYLTGSVGLSLGQAGR
jgi:inosose dehydratase